MSQFVRVYIRKCMEQQEGYKQAVANIKNIEQQLQDFSRLILPFEDSVKEAERIIEEHFNKLFSALNARKLILLQEVADKLHSFKTTQKRVEEVITAGKQVLEATSYLSNASGIAVERIWKEMASITISYLPYVVNTVISALFPNDILHNIQTYGEVKNSQPFAVVDTVDTFAGSTLPRRTDANGLNACFNKPWGMCMNSSDRCLYICDHNSSAIRKLTMQGDVSTFVNNTIPRPTAIAFDHKRKTFVVAHTDQISEISHKGEVRLIAGSTGGYADGMNANAQFITPWGVAVNSETGDVFVSDFNHVIRKVTQGLVATLAGSPGEKGFADGYGKDAKFNLPYGMHFDKFTQSLLVCDFFNDKIRQVKLNGDVSTVCDIPRPCFITVTEKRTILVTSHTHTIYRLVLQGKFCVAEIIAGSGEIGKRDGKADASSFNTVCGIAVDELSHSCFIADNANNVIRKLSFM